MCSMCNIALEGIIQGVASGIVWLLLATGFTYARDAFIRNRLRRAFSYISADRTHHGFGITINNRSSFNVVVKDVTLFDTDNTGIRLLYAKDDLDLTVAEKPFKDPRSFVLYGAMLKEADLPAWQLSAISLSAHSRASWLAPTIVFEKHPDFRPVRCHFAIQYQNLLGTPRIIVVDAVPPNNTDVSAEFEKYLQEKASGQLGNTANSGSREFNLVTTRKMLNQKDSI